MTYIERKEEMLKKQIIEQTKEADFEVFWKNQVKALREVPLKIERRELNLPYKTFKVYEIVYNTHDDTLVTGYFSVPCTYDGKKIPCAAIFHGGGGSFGLNPEFVATGICTFSIDPRSQGGKTYDRADYDVADDYHGGNAIMSHGLLDKENFYMRNIYLDAVRAIDVIATLPEVDTERIVAHGQSQGGALTIVASALSGKVKKAYPSVPSYSCLEKRVENGSGVFGAVNAYLRANPEETDRVMRTLSYFDINNMASLLKVPTEFFLGLSDPTCLPAFVYSPYAHTTAEKNIVIGPFTPHTISKEYKYKLLGELAAL